MAGRTVVGRLKVPNTKVSNALADMLETNSNSISEEVAGLTRTVVLV
jgi:hypothetical protein